VSDDQERLVAEALRAHAARTPLPEPQQVDSTADQTGSQTGTPAGTRSATPTSSVTGVPNGPAPGGYGPPTGGVAPPRPDRIAEPPTAYAPGYPPIHPAPFPALDVRAGPAGGVAVGWVLLLAVLLGLASGAVVGMLTLL
jgi:hypothetical protein